MANRSTVAPVPNAIHIFATPEANIPNKLLLALWAYSANGNSVSISPSQSYKDDFIAKDKFDAYLKILTKLGFISKFANSEMKTSLAEKALPFMQRMSENPRGVFVYKTDPHHSEKISWNLLYDSTTSITGTSDKEHLASFALSLLFGNSSAVARLANYCINNKKYIDVADPIFEFLEQADNKTLDAFFAVLCHKDKRGHCLFEEIDLPLRPNFSSCKELANTVKRKINMSHQMPSLFRSLHKCSPGRKLEVDNFIWESSHEFFSENPLDSQTIYKGQKAELEYFYPELADYYQSLGETTKENAKIPPKDICLIYNSLCAELKVQNPQATAALDLRKDEPLSQKTEIMLEHDKYKSNHFKTTHALFSLAHIIMNSEWYNYEYSVATLLSQFFLSDEPTERKKCDKEEDLPDHVKEIYDILKDIASGSLASKEGAQKILSCLQQTKKIPFFKRDAATQEFYEQAEILLSRLNLNMAPEEQSSFRKFLDKL